MSVLIAFNQVGFIIGSSFYKDVSEITAIYEAKSERQTTLALNFSHRNQQKEFASKTKSGINNLLSGLINPYIIHHHCRRKCGTVNAFLSTPTSSYSNIE